ncbi:type I-U CRISPR-associated helicase/endonuclease Cas3 [Bifidobacterium moraviense]|nr:type I-U CRISPR-associated helicase/endonuclease Cas3 [Bifidobacterium sp. DSM 109958]
MNELLGQFDAFVSAVHDGRKPYQWQRRLVRFIIEHGRWPERIAAPTGAGKTMAIDVHVFLSAMAGLAKQPSRTAPDGLADTVAAYRDALARLPRRLVMTVNRRALVDDQYEAACALAACLDDPGQNDLLHAVRQGLIVRERGNLGDGEFSSSEYCRVTRLRGGAAIDPETRSWRYRPTACQIICATPDMFGSRLLFHGYGVTPEASPIEAGLLAYDTVLVADEAHLNRQLVKTAMSVQRLERLQANPVADCVTPLQVVSTTATQQNDGAAAPDNAEVGSAETEHTVGVDERDFAVDEALKSRLTKPKPVALEEYAGNDKQFAQSMAELCVKTAEAYGDGGVIGVIVNSVAMARDVRRAMEEVLRLRKKKSAATDESVKRCEIPIDKQIQSFVGPMREYDKRQLMSGRLFDAIQGDSTAQAETGLCFVIATQTMEVGVDADFAALVTELPSASALAQRAGRVNRRGKREAGPIIVVAHDATPKNSVYTDEELQQAKDWIDSLPQIAQHDGSSVPDMAAWNTVQCPPPADALRRAALQRLEAWDVENLSHTDEQLSGFMSLPMQGAADLNLWLRDDLQPDDVSVGVVVRDLPQGDADACAVLNAARPVPDEVFPVRNRRQLDDIDKAQRRAQQKPQEEFRILIVRSRDGDDAVTAWQPQPDLKLSDVVRAGDVLVVDANAKLFDRGLHVLTPELGEKKCERECDVQAQCQRDAIVVSTTMSVEAKQNDATNQPARVDSALAQALVKIRDADLAAEHDEAESLKQLLDETEQQLLKKAIDKVYGSQEDDSLKDRSEWWMDAATDRLVVPLEDAGDDPVWMVLRTAVDALSGGAAQQEMRVPRKNSGLVYLDRDDGHQRSVEVRATRFLDVLGIVDGIREDVALAARHHDDGKKDRRFQRLLHYRLPEPDQYDASTYLAKSRFRVVAVEQRLRRELDLQGWRHEQRSAADIWANRNAYHAHDAELVTRLAGTSHGHGRSCFRDNAERLIPQSVMAQSSDPDLDMASIRKSAEALFGDGLWERIITRTNARYGIWGMAYLEAILRAADVNVSTEGR